MITEEQIKLLESYKDKAYVAAVLCEKTATYYGFYKHIFNIPLIFTSTIMSIINSSEIEQEKLKYVNIVFNGITAITLALMNNFKFAERNTIFKNTYVKFTKLLHNIEDSLINDKDNITTDNIRDYINTYDNLFENLDFGFPESIKQEVRKMYQNNRYLPNILNCTDSALSNNQRLRDSPPSAAATLQFTVPRLQDN